MSNPGEFRQFPVAREASLNPTAAAAGDSLRKAPVGGADPRVPLLNLSTVRARMDSVHRFISESVNSNTLMGKDQMDMVSTEIASAIHLIIVNGAALLACAQSSNLSSQSEQIAPRPPEVSYPIASRNSTINTQNARSLSESDLNFNSANSDINLSNASMYSNNNNGVADLKLEPVDEEISDEWEIIELDSVELLAEHIHFCDICGKGFKRDANVRMHMRAHGNQFKTPEALTKPETSFVEVRRRTRFSCPFVGCNRNKLHKKFRPLRSVICVKNHFKRSHCPKMYLCNRCNKKSFSVVADLKSHLKHCGETKWKCSCGTSFSRKDNLFGHMALFEGHMPAVLEDDETPRGTMVMVEDEEDEDPMVKEMEFGGPNCSENGLFEGLLEGFESIENYCLQDLLDSPSSGLGSGMVWDLL